MRWIEQRFALFNGLDVLNHRAKFGEYRTTRMFVCLFVRFFVTLRVWRAVRSSGRYFEQLFCRRSWVDFDSVFALFQK